MSFRITGLSPQTFAPLWGLADEALAERGVTRMVVDGRPRPDRIELRDAEPGETVLLLNHLYQPAETPYHGRHAIFVLEGATQRYEGIDTIPDVMATRPLSLRGFGEDGMLVDADPVEGRFAAPAIETLFADPPIAYIHAHYAKYGCYAARIDRH